MGAVRQGDSVSRPARDSTTIAGSSSRQDKPSASSLRRHIQRFPQASVLVIGDLILDHYVWGRVTRISPEAPVPVVHVESESMRLGGAANVFNNILALGGKADLCGMIGSDEAGVAPLDPSSFPAPSAPPRPAPDVPNDYLRFDN